MKFEEILEPLRNGKKVRRKCWKEDILIGFSKYEELRFIGSDASVPYVLEREELNATDWQIYHEPILDEEERKYLSAVIKPFRDRLGYIKKSRDLSNSFERITIRIASVVYRDSWADIDFPYFKANSMYKNMKLDKNYTLAELGL